jgi:hypothetical protein
VGVTRWEVDEEVFGYDQLKGTWSGKVIG